MARRGEHATAVKRIVLVTHSERANPGRVRAALHARGCATEVCWVSGGDSLPPMNGSRLQGYDAAVVFGGPMSACDIDDHAFLREETAWIAAQMAADAPLLGICLGAQIMARALGGRVYPHPDALCEVGYQPVYPASAACPLFPAPIHVYHWHREGFDLPPGAVLLARGGIFENQAFGHGARAFGVQFHPEMTPATLERWVTNEKAQRYFTRPEVPSADRQRADAGRHDPAVHRWLDRFLDRWLERF
jgi:GMP synthase (glutamine-hydrolysing)